MPSKDQHGANHTKGEIVAMVVLLSGARGYVPDLPLGDFGSLPNEYFPPHVIYLTSTELGSWTPISELPLCKHGNRVILNNSKLRSTKVLEMVEMQHICAGCGNIFPKEDLHSPENSEAE